MNQRISRLLSSYAAFAPLRWTPLPIQLVRFSTTESSLGELYFSLRLLGLNSGTISSSSYWMSFSICSSSSIRRKRSSSVSSAMALIYSYVMDRTFFICASNFMIASFRRLSYTSFFIKSPRALTFYVSISFSSSVRIRSMSSKRSCIFSICQFQSELSWTPDRLLQNALFFQPNLLIMRSTIFASGFDPSDILSTASSASCSDALSSLA